jgi:hypothetical protein
MDPSVARAGFEDSAMMSAEGASVELDIVAQVRIKTPKLSNDLAHIMASLWDLEIFVVFQFDRKEVAAKNPPTSLVPRLHVLHYVKLDSCNPLLPISDVTTAPKPDLVRLKTN